MKDNIYEFFLFSRHLFAIANAAYSKLMDAKHNQVIIIR